MSISLLSQTQNICQELNLNPTKSKGQNFLIERQIVDDIIKSSNLKSNEIVLEIGPGLGVLTQELLKQTKKVVAIELDKKLFNYLSEKFKRDNNLKLIEGDILELLDNDIINLLGQEYKVIANLPYQITSYILRRLLELKNRPVELVVMVQKEVAERICASAGQMSVLAVMVQYYSQPQIVRLVGKDNFWPAPQVDSAILRLVVKKIDNDNINNKKFFKLVNIGFSNKRKMLKNNLANVYNNQQIRQTLNKLNLDLKIRAQELNIDDWIKLYKELI